MRIPYVIGLVLYITFLLTVVFMFFLPDDSPSGFIAFDGIVRAIGILLIICGSILFGIYFILVFAFYRGKRAFLITLSAIVLIIVAIVASFIVKEAREDYIREQQRKDFSFAITLQEGVPHKEGVHLDNKNYAKYKIKIREDGDLSVRIVPETEYTKNAIVYVYNPSKELVFKNNLNVPDSVTIKKVKHNQMYYLIVYTFSSNDIYTINATSR